MTRSSLAACTLSLLLSVAGFACSSNGTQPQGGTGGKGSGGSSPSGGTTNSGGATSGGTTASSTASGGTQAGGSLASGGSSATGGRSGSGGTTASSAGTGGNTSTGGSSSQPTAGMTGSGGSTSRGGNTVATGGSGGASAGSGGGAGATGSGGTTTASGGRSSIDAGTVPDAKPIDGGGGSGGAGGRGDGSVSTGGAGGGSGSGSCAASPCKVLPLGDSITLGLRSSDSGGYRSQLFKLVVAANQNVTFTGSQQDGPDTVSGKPFPKNHEGHSGFTVTQITGYVPPAKAFTATPDIVLLHIGTNDMTSNADPTTTANQLDTLVTNLVAAAPNALIVVAKIVPLGYSNNNYTSYIAKIPGIVSAHAAKNQNVIMVDMSTLPGSDIRGSGDVHPTDQGYADMANLWYGAIKGLLK